ncbi:metallo-beta-lactamase [Cryptococcus deuterogattii LA55]|nr:metallo-beta-lactamase [Cryptococcus deuterogattii LA55]KIR70591.1 metallo-beta-lactamase [Cryptococcus deuterogattii CA1014]KIR90829.1 metallo-beta-lactamase [Cryptococcus deuterogattii CBS 10090]
MPTSQPLQLLFLGTATSTGLPLTPCLTLSTPYPQKWSNMVPLLQDRERLPSRSPSLASTASSSAYSNSTYDPEGEWPKNIPCACCRSAVDPDVPEGWKNKRGNTSVLLRKQTAEGDWKNVLVDVDADAYFGLDDLREWCVRQGSAIPVYLNKETFRAVEETFPYMVDKTKVSGGGDVPQLIWKVIEDEGEFQVEGIDVRVFPVHHGIYFHSVLPPTNAEPVCDPPTKLEPEPLICLAFEFDASIIYMSDVSGIPQRTWDRMLRTSSKRQTILPTPVDSRGGDETPRGVPKNQSISDLANLSISSRGSRHLERTRAHNVPVLIVDALWPTQAHTSHFSLAQALIVALRLRAANTYVIGSTHPTSHFMWEEICNSLTDRGGRDYEVRDHPDAAQAEWLVKKVWDKVFGEGEHEGLGERWIEEGGRVQPAWDGLVLEVGGDQGLERADLISQGLLI